MLFRSPLHSAVGGGGAGGLAGPGEDDDRPDRLTGVAPPSGRGLRRHQLDEAGNERQWLMMKGTSADFDISSKSKPIEVVVDPDTRLLRSSEELRQGVIVRRGIEHFREQEYVEAEQQFQAAIKLNRANSWAWYNLEIGRAHV